MITLCPVCDSAGNEARALWVGRELHGESFATGETVGLA
jgi:hypothetical protein